MEFSQSQIELGHIYEVPYSQRDSGEAIATAATVVTLVTVLTLSMIYWGVILWRLPSKAGYTGATRWAWFLLLYFPLTGGLTLFAFVFASWPVKKQLEKSAGQLDEVRRLTPKTRTPLTVDDELEQMRRQLHG
jgi:hypothetical protein